VTQALEIKAKAVYRRIFENPCVGGSIPPRATKLNNALLCAGHFLLVWQAQTPLVSDIPIKNCPLKGHVNYSSLRQSMSF
jgi:hypothetical protein